MDDPTNVVLRVSMSLNELAIAFGFFERVEVLTLDILNQRQFGGRRFIDIANDRGDRMLARTLRCPPPPLPSDDHIILAVRPQKNRLQDTPFADGLSKFV